MMKKCCLLLLLTLGCTKRIQTIKIADLPELNNPIQFEMAENHLIVVDDKTIHIYSMDPFQHKTHFGKPGKGSGEFQYRLMIKVYPDTILAMDFTKTCWYNLQGELIREIAYADMEGFNLNQEMELFPIREDFIRITVDHDLHKKYIDLLNSHLKFKKRIYEGLFDWTPIRPGMEDYPVMGYRIDVRLSGDKLFIFDNSKGFRISVYDHASQRLGIIDKNEAIDKIPVTKSDKQKALDYLKTHNARIYDNVKGYKFMEFFPAMNDFQVSDDRMVVTTYREKEGQHEIIILDHQGNILKRMFLPIRSKKFDKTMYEHEIYRFKGDNLYELIQDETTGEWGLYGTKIDRGE